MVLIPERDYNNFFNPSTTLTNNLGGQIMEVQNQNITNDVRNLRESELISKLRSLRNPSTNTLSQEQIVNKMPEQYKRRGRVLLDSIEQDSWTPLGELVKDNQVIPNTNIVDLVHRSIVEGNKRDVVGLQEFQDLLKQRNTPLTFLNKETRVQLTDTKPKILSDTKPKSKSKSIQPDDTESPISHRTRKNKQKGKGFIRILPGKKLLYLK